MDFLSSTLYGIIQGISEFLPVSSSGHLALIPHFLKISAPGLTFDFAMHIGTFLATLIYFYKDLKQEFSILFQDRELTHRAKNIIVTTAISVVLILLFKPYAEVFRSPSVIAFNLIFFGVLLALSDIFTEKDTKMTHFHAALIGLAQALAVFPGVSRSGATITMGRFTNQSRKNAGNYSFLVSLPILLAGIIYKTPEMLSSNQGFDILFMIWGIFVSFFIGILTIHFFLKLISKCPLYIFSLYRLLIGLVIIYLLIL